MLVSFFSCASIQELSLKEASIAQTQEKISICTSKLNELQDQYEEVSEALKLKGAGGSAGSDGGSAGGVISRLKDALLTIKAEIKSMTASIAMLNYSILAERKSAAAALAAGRRAAVAQRKTRRNPGARNEAESLLD